jgi:hypothetical protein
VIVRACVGVLALFVCICLPDIKFNNIHNKQGEEKEFFWLHVAVFFVVKFNFHMCQI